MFSSKRYFTRGVQAAIPFDLQMFMWFLVTILPEPKDHLQVFRLSVSEKGNQHIVHEQEVPAYSREYEVQTDTPVNAKVYVIDDGDHSTILLAEEY